MKKLFSLEVTESNMEEILQGDEVIVDGNAVPEGNGRDIGVFLINDEYYISKFTRYGNQVIMLQKNGRICVIRSVNLKVVGKVVDGSFEMNTQKAPAVTGTQVSYA